MARRLKDRKRACILAIIVMMITLIPYCIAAGMANGRCYMWLGHNLDDSCVYLSWMRQSADGAFIGTNLFTVDSQPGALLNPLFLVLGKLAGLTHIPLIAIYHGSRLLFGFALLLMVWRVLETLVANHRARWLSFLFVCFSSGLGWLPLWWNVPPLETPIDKWQPEAITFLSLYLSPLFCFSMALQVGIFALLFASERHKNLQYSVVAGCLGLVLGLVHSYDIISVSAVWSLYLVVAVLTRQISSPGGTILRTATAGLLTLPAVVYMYFQYRNNPVFRARADVATLSPPLAWIVLGYGLTLLLAGIGTYALLKKRNTLQENSPVEDYAPEHHWTSGTDASLFLAVWAVANIAISYLPHAAFQRKMLQGAHFPIAILAGIGGMWLFSRYLQTRWRKGWVGYAVAASALLAITNIRFMERDLEDDALNITQTHQQRPYLQPGEIEALRWIESHTNANTVIQPLPWISGIETGTGHLLVAPTDMSLACFSPGLIHRRVYCGHWGETPSYIEKLHTLMQFEQQRMSDEDRKALLRTTGIRYLVFSQKQPDEMADRLLPIFRNQLPVPDYLTRVYGNADAEVFEVNTARLSP